MTWLSSGVYCVRKVVVKAGVGHLGQATPAATVVDQCGVKVMARVIQAHMAVVVSLFIQI